MTGRLGRAARGVGASAPVADRAPARATGALLGAALMVATLTGCSGTSGVGTSGSDTSGAGTAAPSASTPGRAASPNGTPGAPAPLRPTSAAPPSPAPFVPPPYVAGVRWVSLSGGRSLQVRPTAAGRTTSAPYPEAWGEVLHLAPGADTPGMRAQFACHWSFARVLAPDKPTWNLEPWRPVVSPDEMLADGCNPGGAE